MHHHQFMEHCCSPMQTLEVAETVPSANIYEMKEEFILVVDLPGATKESVSVKIDQQVLTVEAVAGQGDDSRKFSRRFNVGDGLNLDTVRAEFNDGVLTVKIAKTESALPREIKIQ